MANRLQLRGDTSTIWTSVNPILSQKELGLELDTNKIKIGDGITTWNSLPYITDSILAYINIKNLNRGNISSYVETSNSATQSIPNGGVVTKVLFGNELQDQLGEFTNSRFTSLTTQKVLVSAISNWPTFSTASKDMSIFVYKNGSALYPAVTEYVYSVGTQGLTVSVPVLLNTSDYIEIYVSHTDTTSKNLAVNSQRLLITQIY